MFLPNLINKVAIDTKRIRFDYKMHNQPAVKEKRENLLRNKKIALSGAGSKVVARRKQTEKKEWSEEKNRGVA